MKATYIDDFGSIDTEIINHPTENGQSYMTMNLEGILFKGSSFDDFELLNIDHYAPEQIKRFTLNRVQYSNSKKFSADLCNCTLIFDIPCTVIEVETKKNISTFLHVKLTLGNPASNGGIDTEIADFQLTLQNKSFESQAEVFEEGLDGLRNQMGEQYKFKNCYGCLYADYSPYGVGFFDSLMCFKKTKNAYLALNKDFSKEQYFNVIDDCKLFVQETYCCSEFKIRPPGTGYRG